MFGRLRQRVRPAGSWVGWLTWWPVTVYLLLSGAVLIWVWFSFGAIGLTVLAVVVGLPVLALLLPARATRNHEPASPFSGSPSSSYSPSISASPVRPVFTAEMAAERRHRESLGQTGRMDPRLDQLNRALTDSLDSEALWRIKHERERDNKPTGQIDAALAERGELGRSWVDEILH